MHRSSQLYKYPHISYSNKSQFSSVSIKKLPDFSSSDCIDSQEALHQYLRAQFSSLVYKHKLLLQLQGRGQVAPLEFKSLGQPKDYSGIRHTLGHITCTSHVEHKPQE